MLSRIFPSHFSLEFFSPPALLAMNSLLPSSILCYTSWKPSSVFSEFPYSLSRNSPSAFQKKKVVMMLLKISQQNCLPMLLLNNKAENGH